MPSIFKRDKSKNVNHGFSLDAKSPTLSDARSIYDATFIKDITNRTQVTLVGNVVSTRIVPSAKSFWLEVIIDDGTGTVDGWFFGRKEIKGIQLGSLLLFKGLVQLDQGEMTIANPYYQIL